MADQQRADLAALGITFDGEPVVQSQRLDAYQHALLKLADRTYECFCSRAIVEAASAPHGSVARYPGICRNLTEAERTDRRLRRSPHSGSGPTALCGPCTTCYMARSRRRLMMSCCFATTASLPTTWQ